MARYLDLGLIRPGDVILSSSLTLKSIAIRLFTRSRVSHALIAIHPLIWFEAIGSGVRYKVIDPTWISDGKRIRLATRIPVGDAFSILRPDGLYKTDGRDERHAVAKALITASSRFAFLNYANPEDFLAILKFGLDRNAFLRFLAAKLGQPGREFFSGPFCSWLVAECYQDLGLELFDDSPKRTLPGTLARSRELKTVNAVFRGKALPVEQRFARLQSNLNLAVALASTNLKMLERNANFDKSTTLANDSIGKFVKAEWRTRGSPPPDETSNVFKAIEEAALAGFRDSQAKAINALELAYSSLALHTEYVEGTARCLLRCDNPWPDGISCGSEESGSCTLATRDYQKILDEIYAVFPMPSIPEPS